MLYVFYFFILAANYLHAEKTPSNGNKNRIEAPNPIVNLEAQPSAFVNGCVNVLTGEFVDSQVDLVLPGVEPFILQRSYSRSDEYDENVKGVLGRGWNLNFDSQLSEKEGNYDVITLNEKGGRIPFKMEQLNFIHINRIHPAVLSKGVTNTGSGIFSGQADLKNLRMVWDDRGDMWCVQDGSGTIKYYAYAHDSKIVREAKIAGNQVLYKYQNKNLRKVKFSNSVGKTMASFQFSKKHDVVDVLTNDQQQIRYHFHHGKLKKVERPEAPFEEYKYDPSHLVISKEYPNGRFTKITYYEGGKNKVGEEIVKIDHTNVPMTYRVSQLLEPAGVDATPIVTYTFKYDRTNRITFVKDAHQVKTNYYYDINERLSHIDRCKRDGNVYCRDQSYWKGHRLSARLIIPQADLSLTIAGKTYEYDEAGNVITERLYGNLSGINPSIPMISSEAVGIDNGCEYYEKRFVYTNDGLNLLHYETDGNQAITYLYCPGNNKLSAKIYRGNGRIYKREFYEYNSDLAITKHTIDNGNTENFHNLEGVTKRYITNYAPRLVFPVGLPEVVETKCLDMATEKEILINLIVNDYWDDGKLKTQAHYDNQRNHAYTLYWEYHRGNLIKEVDALGRVILREYDENNNLIMEQGPHPDVKCLYTYDFMNRLIKEEEIHTGGQHHCTTYRYDLVGNRIATIDTYGHETLYEYDEFHRLVRTTSPPLLDQFGSLYQPCSTLEYDWLGNVTLSRDERSMPTVKFHTIRNQAYYTKFPDGTVELNIYNLDGTLQKKVKTDGTSVLYSYDFGNRPIKQETYAPDGTLLETTSALYDAFHLLSETDAAGHVTTYEYTPEGKVSRVSKGNSETLYQYDSLGRVHKTINAYGYSQEEIIVVVQEYDVLDRVIEKTIEDYAGHVLTRTRYTYDFYSEKPSQVIEDNAHGIACISALYNSHNEPVLLIDPHGNQTVINRSYSHYNERGQYVAYVESIDSNGNFTITEYDTHGRVAAIIRTNSFGQILQKQEKRYDASGNVMAVINFNQNKPITTFYEHDGLNRLFRMTEAWGTPQQRTTSIQYCSQGKKSHHIKPDGVILYYSYDSLGHLTGYNASDMSFSYIYEYDANHNPISIRDLIHNTITHKIYDINDRLIEEKLGNGLSISYTYDQLSRPMTTTLPDQTVISYSYQANQLKKVTYGHFTHEYLSYDQADNLLSAKLIGNAGIVNYSYDLLNRQKEILHPKWSETIDQFDRMGNLLQKTIDDKAGTLTSRFCYDNLYQLTKEEGASSHQYEYDNLNNCILKDGQNQEFDEFNRQLNDANYLFSYDVNGNLTARGDQEVFEYDALNRLITHSKDNIETRYVYDSQNRRLSKSKYTKQGENRQLDSTVRYIFQGQNEIGICDFENRMTELRILGSGKGSEIGSAIAIKIANKMYAPLHDHIGNVVCLLDASNGQVIESYRYTAFGQQIFSSAESPWLFASKRFDEETGFVYFGRRYYDPQTSRWTSTDPIGTADGPNLYAYVHNSPLTHFDPYGLYAYSDSLECANLAPSIGREVNRNIFKREMTRICDLNPRKLKGPRTYFSERYENSCFNRNKPEIITIPGISTLDKGFLLIYTNGMNNTRDDYITGGMHISDLSGGYEFTVIGSPTNGIPKDLVRVNLSRFGLASAAVTVMKNFCKKNLDANPNLQILIVSHSEGGINTYNHQVSIDEVYRNCISTLTVAPGKYLDRYLCKSVVHLVSETDPIAKYNDFFGRIRCQETVKMLKPHANAGLIDHTILSETYDNNLIIELKRFIKNE